MYRVEKFEVQDEAVLISVIEKAPFATVVTTGSDGTATVNHLPVFVRRNSNGRLSLCGHMSKRNSQWLEMQAGSPVTIAFHGPQGYINPNWYAEDDVPTWNYIVIHAKGIATVLSDLEGLLEILKLTSSHMNRLHGEKWDFYLPPDLRSEADVTGSIVGFEIFPASLVGKFKLNQNRSMEDRHGVIRGLASRSDDGSRGVAAWMKMHLDSSSDGATET